MSKEIIKFALAIAGVMLGWVMIIPIFELPDEQGHFAMVQFLAEEGRVPSGVELDLTRELKVTEDLLGTFRDKDGNNSYTYHPEHHVEYIDSVVGKNESEIISLNTNESRKTYVWHEAARYPRLYYDYSAFWYKLVGRGDIILRTYMTRVGTVVLAVFTGVLLYYLGLLIFAKKSSAITLAILVMLQPMFSFLSAGINSDNLHNLLFIAVIYCGITIIKYGISRKVILTSGIIVILDIITKPQGYIALAVILLAILIEIIQSKKWRMLSWLIGLGSLTAGSLFIPGNPYNVWVNSGNIHNQDFIEFFRFSFDKLISQNIVWYWGVFKWLGIVLPPIYWQVANRVVIVGVIGLCVYAWKAMTKRKLIVITPITIFLLLSTIAYTVAIYLFDWQFTKKMGYSLGVQARYYFPTISSQMALLMIGIISIGWNNWTKTWLRLGLIIFIIWMQLGGIWRLITSYYDVSSTQSFITQASQYKPGFAKGDMWLVWGVIYTSSLTYLSWLSVVGFKQKKK